MRHRKKTVKLGRTAEHRNALLANQACSLIEHGRITTTLAKAKAVRPLAEKMVTLAKRGGLHARRRALALLHNNSTRTVKAVGKLFSEIAPRSANRHGGYTRVVKLGPRPSDSAPMAFIEWVDLIVVEESTSEQEKKSSQKTSKPSGTEDKTAKK
jgi:large subunit ribosomal protein L17